MTIRSRLTFWYAGILFFAVMLITGLSWREFAEERRIALASDGKYTEYDGWEDLTAIGLSCGLPAAAIALIGGWWLMRRSLAPVTALTRAAAQLQEGRLREQLPRSGNGDELDQLTRVFNAMTARLDDSFNRIREFTLHASHELKTPLTVLRGELETALQEGKLEPQAREHLLSQLDEIQRLANIVDGLSLLTKADAGLVQLNSEPVRLDELVRESFADAQILARPFDVCVELDCCDDVTVSGDRHRLRQLLLNLTDNAVKYNEPRGSVTMNLVRSNGSARLRITNTGPGIPEVEQPRIFERFFRGYTPWVKPVEGCGLGLSICKWIVGAHGGSIQITSRPDPLTTATLILPVCAVTARGPAAPQRKKSSAAESANRNPVEVS